MNHSPRRYGNLKARQGRLILVILPARIAGNLSPCQEASLGPPIVKSITRRWWHKLVLPSFLFIGNSACFSGPVYQAGKVEDHDTPITPKTERSEVLQRLKNTSKWTCFRPLFLAEKPSGKIRYFRGRPKRGPFGGVFNCSATCSAAGILTQNRRKGATFFTKATLKRRLRRFHLRLKWT